MGWIEEAPVVYESADNVPYARGLLGLALLEDTYLVQEARAVYGRLKNGWYGLRSLLWTLVAMALLRIKRPEQLKHHDPAELGRVLGMPRGIAAVIGLSPPGIDSADTPAERATLIVQCMWKKKDRQVNHRWRAQTAFAIGKPVEWKTATGWQPVLRDEIDDGHRLTAWATE